MDTVRLGTPEDKQEGMYVRFDYGTGLDGTNVYIGFRRPVWKNSGCYPPREWEDHDCIGMSIVGWEHLCALVDEWRQRGGQG